MAWGLTDLLSPILKKYGVVVNVIINNEKLSSARSTSKVVTVI